VALLISSFRSGLRAQGGKVDKAGESIALHE
jgi:hypothetical protein